MSLFNAIRVLQGERLRDKTTHRLSQYAWTLETEHLDYSRRVIEELGNSKRPSVIADRARTDRDRRFRLQLHRCAVGLNLTEFSDGTCASSTAPDGKRHEQEIENNKDCDICLAADTESVAMQTFTQNKVHAIPGH
jgi:hypothetical protein